MALPWVRLDSNIYGHDKILALKSDPSPKKWQAIAVYMMSFAWSGGQGTDGFIPNYALEQIHATAVIARLLVKYGLWDDGIAGYWIRNFADRQQLTTDQKTPEEIKQSQHIGGIKGNCIKYHGRECGCWRDAV